MNKSEQLLEGWCSSCCWGFEKIPVGAARTSDYRIYISGVQIYAEVKEILANDDEKKVIRELAENKITHAYSEEPGKTIRQKIKDSYEQIKRFTEPEKCPGVLALYNNSGMSGLGRLAHYHVLTGMFGLQTIPVTVPKDPAMQPIYGADFLGTKKSVTPNQNRYLSGLMTLFEHHEKGLMLFFYHNPYAQHPIDPILLRVSNCIQYCLGADGLNWALVEDEQG